MKGTLGTFRDLLSQFVSFKSVSTDKRFSVDIHACAMWLQELFEARGFDVRVTMEFGNPIIIAHYDAGSLETCLIYGHYDVQPADISDGWNNDPFTLTEVGDRLVGRGVVDDKGLLLMHMVSIFSLIEEKKLRYNVTFFIEGDEESGGANMTDFIEVSKDALSCDFCLISDGLGNGNDPVIQTSMRGMFNVDITIRTATTDMHSGTYGGIASNSADYAARFIERLNQVDSRRGGLDVARSSPLRVGWHSPPRELLVGTLPFDEAAFHSSTGGHLEVPAISAIGQMGYMPAIEVTGISCGYMGPGFRNSIPHESKIKANVRLAPEQPARAAADSFKEWAMKTLLELMPDESPGCTVKIDGTPEDGIMFQYKHNEYLRRALKIAEGVCGKRIYLKPEGGAIPVVRHLYREIKVPIVMLALGNDDSNIHAANENITRACIEQGLEISRMFFSSDSDL